MLCSVLHLDHALWWKRALERKERSSSVVLFDSAWTRKIGFRRMGAIGNGRGDGRDVVFYSRGFEKGSARKKT